MCVRACVCACVRACVRARVRVWVYYGCLCMGCVHARVCVCHCLVGSRHCRGHEGGGSLTQLNFFTGKGGLLFYIET